jgi:glucan-binding YG repeat protein
VEFLDSVMESTRAEEDRVKKETAEGLALFRQQQEEADKRARRGSGGDAVAEAGSPTIEEENWVAGGRKRKRAKDKEVLKGVKLRRSSTANEEKPARDAPSSTGDNAATKKEAGVTQKATATPATPDQKATSKPKSTAPTVVKKPPAPAPAPAKPSMGLVDYGSDEDDD